MLRAVSLALSILAYGALLAAGVVALYWFLLRRSSPQPSGPAFSQIDLITIVLGGATVALAALAIALAVAGAVGYVTIKDAPKNGG